MQNLVLSPIEVEDLAVILSRTVMREVRSEIRTLLKEVTTLPEHPSVKQAAKFLSVSQVTIYEKIKTGHLTVDKLGTRTRLRRDEVLALLVEVESN